MPLDLKIAVTSVSSYLLTLSRTKKLQHQITQFIIVLITIYIAFISAKITWFSISDFNDLGSAVMQNSVMKGQENNKKPFDLKELQSLNLFGKFAEDEVRAAVVQDAPETRLQLVLSGLVASDNVETSAAIIEHKGKQETYGVGDLILGTRASLEQVLMDRVIIKQSGRLETLMLDGFDFKNPAVSLTTEKTRVSGREQRKSSTKVLDYRNNKVLSERAKSLRADLTKDPSKISDYLRISPKRKDGKTIGYSLRPGKAPEFFKLSGLKSGDVAVQMNSYNLVNPSEAALAFTAMREERDISLLVERNGSIIEVLFSIE